MQDVEPKYTVYREGSQRLQTIEHVLRGDWVLTTEGTWSLAAGCEPFATRFRAPAQPLEPLLLTLGRVALGSVVTALGAVAAYKLGQAVFDEEFDSVEFPAWFRAELIDTHVDRFGSWCPRCRRRVRLASLTVDHIVSLRNGGKTSRANAQVLCWPCNSAKGAKNNLFEYVRGR
jgi:hypothetical protein